MSTTDTNMQVMWDLLPTFTSLSVTGSGYQSSYYTYTDHNGSFVGKDYAEAIAAAQAYAALAAKCENLTLPEINELACKELELAKLKGIAERASARDWIEGLDLERYE